MSRELRRNRGQRGYRPKQAHEFSTGPYARLWNGPRIAEETWAFVEARLGELWSPEQICGRLKACGLPAVSHEAIYQRIYADQRNGGTLHRALRCQKARRKRYGGRERRGTIPNQVSIEQRPAIVNSRRRFGDWEGDLVIGAGQHQALVTLNVRKSRYSLIAHVPFKTAQAVSDTMISLLTPFAGYVHTLTTDNGKEFAKQEDALPLYHPHRHRARHASSQPPPQKMPRLQDPSRGLYEAATLSSSHRCTSELNPPRINETKGA